jgi:hypothetical protein
MTLQCPSSLHIYCYTLLDHRLKNAGNNRTWYVATRWCDWYLQDSLLSINVNTKTTIHTLYILDTDVSASSEASTLTYVLTNSHHDFSFYTASLLSLSWARQLSRDVPGHAGFLCDRIIVLGDTIKGTPCMPDLVPSHTQVTRYTYAPLWDREIKHWYLQRAEGKTNRTRSKAASWMTPLDQSPTQTLANPDKFRS